MKIAIPLAEGKLAMHFGYCRSFAIVDTGIRGKYGPGKMLLLRRTNLAYYPSGLERKKVDLIIAGGMRQ